MQSEIEVMRVVRVPPMGALVVQVGNKRITTIADARDEKLRRRLLAAIGELIDFAGGYEALAEAGVAPSLPREKPVSPQLGDEEELTKEQARFLDELERELRGGATLELMPGDELGRSVADQLPLTDAPPTRQNSVGVNLVAEIDRILQKHVGASPTLAKRSIKLRQSPGESLQIVVDNKVYSHPSEIEDEEVKQALKRALKEWEAR